MLDEVSSLNGKVFLVSRSLYSYQAIPQNDSHEVQMGLKHLVIFLSNSRSSFS